MPRRSSPKRITKKRLAELRRYWEQSHVSTKLVPMTGDELLALLDAYECKPKPSIKARLWCPADLKRWLSKRLSVVLTHHQQGGAATQYDVEFYHEDKL